MRTIDVVLGGVTYRVQELPVRKNAGWRKSLEQPFGELTAALAAAPDTLVDSPKQLGDLVRSLSGLLLGSIDTLVNLLFAYSPELSAARAVIEENAYDSEILEAFAGVLSLAYPFGTWQEKIGAMIKQFANGSAAPRTLTN